MPAIDVFSVGVVHLLLATSIGESVAGSLYYQL